MGRAAVTNPEAFPRSVRERLPGLAAGALAVLVLLDGAHSVVSIRRIQAGQTALPSPAASTSNAARRFHLETVQGAHLFGEAPAQARPEAAPARDWLLSGTVATDDPSDGWAILGERARAARLQHAGREMSAGVRLAQVFPDYVVLEIGGQRELVRLPRSIKGGAPVAASIPGAAPEAAAVPVAQVVDADRTPADVLMLHFGGQPHPVNGQSAGLEMYPDEYSRRHYHIQLGDLLTAIDGEPVTDKESATNVLRQVGGGSVRLTLNRGGREFTATVSMPRDN